MRTVLIVEDELLEQEFLKTVVLDELSTKDRVLTCVSGVEAVKLARQSRPDVIFMDILIPEMDGLSAIKEIRKFAPGACVMILSASSDFSYAQTAISLNVYEYLLKPVKPAAFRQIFRRALESVSEKQAVSNDEKHAVSDNDHHSFIEKSIDYICENFKGKLTLQMVASNVFMNTQYFSRMFKKELGVTYTDYVNSLRIKYACKLLENTDYPAYRISSECGFTDPSYFNRVFYQHMKMTPKKYKKFSGVHPETEK